MVIDNYIIIAGIISVVISFSAIVIWLYRPSRNKLYDEYGKIPLKEKKIVQIIHIDS